MTPSSTSNIAVRTHLSVDSEQYDSKKLSASIQSGLQNVGKRAGSVMIDMPAAQLEKLRNTSGVNSLDRETKNFVAITALHGVQRVYKSNGWRSFCWAVLLAVSAVLFVWQIIVQTMGYTSYPILSQVSFTMADGHEFPKITICNLNPVRKTYIEVLNSTGDLSPRLLDYILESTNDVTYGYAKESTLRHDHEELQKYMARNPNFTVEEFFSNAGFDCASIMKLCYLAGREFDCCKYSTPVLTPLGKCEMFNFQNVTEKWMRRQTLPGLSNGLQFILDAHLEEQMDGTGGEPEPVFTTSLENGFQFYISDPDLGTYLTSQAMGLSPGNRIYSALTMSQYNLLDKAQWGNCTSEWPPGYSGANTLLKYSSTDCISKCKAKFYFERCGCSPFVFNIDDEYPSCMPYQTFKCTQEYVAVGTNGTNEELRWPSCSECPVECSHREYVAFNSYGNGFSNGALNWLSARHPAWTPAHIMKNFLTINIYFKELTYIQYAQVQATNISQLISNIGGNMGMFLGMSVFTVFETVIYLGKITWISFSKRRRRHLVRKKQKEEEQQQALEHATKTIQALNSSHGLQGLVAVTAGLGGITMKAAEGADRLDHYIFTRSPDSREDLTSLNRGGGVGAGVSLTPRDSGCLEIDDLPKIILPDDKEN